MYVCMCVCMYANLLPRARRPDHLKARVCMCMYVYMNVGLHVYTIVAKVRAQSNEHTCDVHIHTYIHTHIPRIAVVRAQSRAHTMCIYMQMHICIHTYIHTHIS